MYEIISIALRTFNLLVALLISLQMPRRFARVSSQSLNRSCISIALWHLP